MKAARFEWFGFIFVILSFIALACRSSAPTIQDQPSSTIASQPTINPTENTNQTSGGSTVPANIWSRRDVPPSDVINQIKIVSPGGAGGGGNSPCDYAYSELMNDQIHVILVADYELTDQIKINQEVYLCAGGINPNENLEVTITDPNRSLRELPLLDSFIDQPQDSQGNVHYVFAARIPVANPSDPLGRYTINLTSENGSEEINFNLELADHLNAGRYDGRNWGADIEINKGETIYIPLAGFPPRAQIKFDLFEFTNKFSIQQGDPSCGHSDCEGRELTYITTWFSSTDTRGELNQEITTDTNIPANEYLLLISGPNAPLCKFSTPFLSNFGFDWQKMRCDIPIDIFIQ